MKLCFACLVSSILGSLVTVWLAQPMAAKLAVAQPPLQDADDPAEQALTPEETINVNVYETANRSAVHITTRSLRQAGFFLSESTEEGTGSGCVLDQEGHVLTNFHVIEDARQVTATLHNGQSYTASYVGADPINDLAVIKIEADQKDLVPVEYGDSSRLRVGMRVFAIGNPFGLERTMTTGIISSLNRSLQIQRNRTIKSIIQIDAAINPGNSGGPLMDTRGQLIGINVAIASRTGQSAGVGFAIPINLAARVVPQLIEHGRVIRPELGIQRAFETERGILVERLTPGGAAERAGLRGPRIVREQRGRFLIERIDRSVADLIVGVDGMRIESWDDLLSYVESRRPGDTVTLRVRRANREYDADVVLGGGDPMAR